MIYNKKLKMEGTVKAIIPKIPFIDESTSFILFSAFARPFLKNLKVKINGKWKELGNTEVVLLNFNIEEIKKMKDTTINFDGEIRRGAYGDKKVVLRKKSYRRVN